MLTNVMSWVFALSVAGAGYQSKMVDAGYVEPHYAPAAMHLAQPDEGLSIAVDHAGYVDSPDGRYWLKRLEFSPDYGRGNGGLRLVHEDRQGNVLRLVVRCDASQQRMLQDVFVDLLVPREESGSPAHVLDMKTLFPKWHARLMSRKLDSRRAGDGLVAVTWQAITPKARSI